MGEIIHLDLARPLRARGESVKTAQRSLVREFVRVFEFEQPMQWRSDRVFSKNYEDRGLYTGPVWVASRLDVQLRIVRLFPGRTRPVLTDRERVRAVLDAAVLMGASARKQRVWEEISVWYLFDDRGRFELIVPAGLAAQWRDRAVKAMRRRGEKSISTHTVTRFLNCAALPAKA